MNTQISRRNFIKKGFLALLAAAGCGAGGRVYAEHIEPNWLDIVNHTISDPLIPKGFSGIKIVQFSDTHLGFQFGLKQLEKIIDKINGIRPDIVFFTGDLLDNPTSYKQPERISPLLAKIRAPLGKYCVYGNHDHGGNGTMLYKMIMDSANFSVLQNKSTAIPYNGEEIHIAGIDDAVLGNPQWGPTFRDVPEQGYCLFLCHAPDLADGAVHYPVSIQFSGHSHGGQVKIPFWGPLITPAYAEKYVEGLYQFDRMTLYVNKGLGTTRLPLRFLSRPELTVFTLRHP